MPAVLDNIATGLAEGRSRREAFRVALGIGAAAAAAPLLPAGRARADTKPTLICSSPAPPGAGTCPPDASFDWNSGCAGGTAYSTGQPSTYNGCGPQGGIAGFGDIVPDNPFDLAKFYPACANHDCCYGTCGSDKSGCDSNFLADMLAACGQAFKQDLVKWGATIAAVDYDACAQVAGIYYAAVSGGGADAFNAGQAQDCKCCCPDGTKHCGAECIDVQHDPANCGACGMACPPGESCVQGKCTCGGMLCAGTESCCGGVCVDTQADSLNCGACGVVCADGHPCMGGVCQECATGYSKCQDGCFDLQTDPLHCGSCSHACASDQTCVGGQCRCPSGDVDCSGMCVDVDTDPNNCGQCGHVCPPGETCSGGACTCGGTPCDPPMTCCSGQCVDLMSDPANCGMCAHAC
jgi:hypothetical protein